jgi:hypothetical protein
MAERHQLCRLRQREILGSQGHGGNGASPSGDTYGAGLSGGQQGA